ALRSLTINPWWCASLPAADRDPRLGVDARQSALNFENLRTIRLSKSVGPWPKPACVGLGTPKGSLSIPPPARGRSKRLEIFRNLGGADRVRTDDLRLAKPALSQLSYSPPKSSLPVARRDPEQHAPGCDSHRARRAAAPAD